jgi:hypothetical protein
MEVDWGDSYARGQWHRFRPSGFFRRTLGELLQGHTELSLENEPKLRQSMLETFREMQMRTNRKIS